MRFIRRSRGAVEPTTDRWVVVGLGNPEAKYGGTRHNVGADVVRALADRLVTPLKPHKAQALVAETFDRPGGTPLTLAVPYGYMNTSGGPVQQVAAFYKVSPERLVVVHDDLDLDLGVVRLKRGGGSGGHNGLKDIEQRLGTRDFLRVRLGIGRPPGRMDPADYVLSRFSARERADVVEVLLQEAGDALLALVAEGLEAAQNRFH